MKTSLFGILGLLLASISAPGQDSQQQFAVLGDLRLESGESIRDCRWATGRWATQRRPVQRGRLPHVVHRDHGRYQLFLESGKLIDTTAYFVVAIDALGNGISTSPSNSRRQPRMKFPRITVRDMVNSQYQLLTSVLHIDHVRAIAGISMGGMQTFEWLVSYPAFMDKAVPIVGSPRLAPYDLLLWQAENDAIRSDPSWRNGDYKEQPARGVLYAFGQLLLTTPERYNSTTRREDVKASLVEGRRAVSFDANNQIRQADAMMALDVAAGFGGSLERAAAIVKAKVLVVVSPSDRMVSPSPAVEFGRALGAEVLELRSDCGHLAFSCEASTLASRVNGFLSE